MIKLKDFELRSYQKSIVKTGVENNLLVVLPTGLGKTAISMMLGLKRLNQFPNQKIILTAPTKPLCQQHFDTFLKHTTIEDEEVVLLTGAISPTKRIGLFEQAQIIIATPQTLQSDLKAERISFEDVVLLTIDEAHRAVANYSYTGLAKEYTTNAQDPKILALTASPGSNLQKIKDICTNLFIQAIETRTETDPDVAPYVQQVKMKQEKVKLPESYKIIVDLIQAATQKRYEQLKSWGFIGKAQKNISKVQLIQTQRKIQIHLGRGTRDPRYWVGISLVAQCIKLSYMQELIETQGAQPFLMYVNEIMDGAITKKTKALRNLAEDQNVQAAWLKAKELQKNNTKHPKLIRLQSLIIDHLKQNPEAKIIVFSSYRDTASEIVDNINRIYQNSAKLFVGQAKRRGVGLTQKEQAQILEEFSKGEFNVLVGTSITEEGIDIPKVDLVIFFEPIPSAIRSVQRRGRTARTAKGEVIILLTEKTRDEAYHWVAINKEKKMKALIAKLQQSLQSELQQTLA